MVMVGRILVGVVVALLGLVGSSVVAPAGPVSPWSEVPSATSEVSADFPSRPRASAGMAVVKDELVVFGGYEECFNSASTCDNVWYDDLYAFDLKTSRWRRGNTAGPRPEPRGYMGQVGHKGTAIVYGGGSYGTKLADLTVFGDMWQYFPPGSMGGERWVERPQIGGPGPRLGPGLEVVGDSIYLFGGVSSILLSDRGAIPGTPLDPDLLERHNDLWRYDLATSRWTQLTPDSGLATPEPVESETTVPGRRHIAHLKAAPNGRTLYLYGGNTFAVGGQWNDLWTYDIPSGAWSQHPFFSDENPDDPSDGSRFVGRTHGASAVAGTNRLVVTMGDKDHEASECDTIEPSQGQRPTNQAWVFDRSQASWAHVPGVAPDGPPPPLKRVAFAQRDGRLYVFGGFGFDCASQSALWNTRIWSLDLTALAVP